MAFQMVFSVSCHSSCFLVHSFISFPIYPSYSSFPFMSLKRNTTSYFSFIGRSPLVPYYVPNLCGYVGCSIPIKRLTANIH